jgi:N,N'-diacetyllegionaminate synthase
MAVRIIAEAGVNHNGDLGIGKCLVEVAATSGADFVKFQTFSADKLVTPETKVAEYQNNVFGKENTQLKLLRKLELSENQHFELKKKCLELNINFMSTAFDLENADFLKELGQEIFKIPSGEITNLPLLRHIGKFKKEIILSSGASNMSEISDALEVLISAGTPLNKITVLHCTSAYPANVDEVNLLAMQSISSEFGVNVGYSDHTIGIEVAIAAVALGARIIEKHFTISRDLEGPDHKASLEPAELKQMVESIRNIEKALGDGIKKPTPGELKNINLIRKSIVAKKNIKKGDLFDEDNLTAKRPNDGISPMQWDQVIGKIADRDYSLNEMIENG